MESNCDERDKREELEMKLKEWIDGDRGWLDLLKEYREKFVQEWFKSEVMCYVLREDVFERIDWDNSGIYVVIGDICLASSVNVQNALKRLINSMQNQLSSNPHIWEKHGRSCKVIEVALWECKDRYESNDPSSQQVYAQILDYLLKLIEMCEDENTIDCAWSVMNHFPFNKYQSTLIKLIDSAGNQLTKQCNRHRKLCEIIEKVLIYSKGMYKQTCDRLFDYLKKLIDYCEDDETIGFVWAALMQLTQFPLSQIWSQVYQPLIQNYLHSSSQLNWRIHRNWLHVLVRHFKHNYFVIFERNEMNMWFMYLRKILHESDHMQLVLSAILAVEKFCLREYFDVESENVLKSELMGRVQSLDSECPLASDLPDEFDFDRYQVEWSARWCVHNVMDRHKRQEMGGKMPLNKLSNDGFEARNDRTDYNFILVRSLYCVTSGVYFYEVTVATNGQIVFGWSRPDAELNAFYPFDMPSKLLKYQPDGDCIFAHLSDCNAGDVIGCLIDLDKRRFVFYCNGKEVEYQGNKENENHEIISTSSYYATAFLFPSQHLYINFGQSPFKFAPNHIQFIDFHKSSGNDAKKYRLAETCEFVVNHHRKFWLKHVPVDNQFDLFYRDKRQNECDELVKRVERDIEEGREVEEMKMELGCTRYIQAIIEEMGKGQGGDKVDVVAQWVGRVIDETIENGRKKFQRTEKFQSLLLELLYPYLHLRINSKHDYTKHRNICIVLSYLIRFSERYDHDFIKHIRWEVFTYLTRTYTQTRDESTKLFVLIALDYLKLSEDEKEAIRANTQIKTLLNKYKCSKHSNIIKMFQLENFKPLSYQLHFMSERFIRNVLNRPIDVDEIKSKWIKMDQNGSNQPQLYLEDQTKHLQVSHDLLSVRSDWKWQSVRYKCSYKYRIDYFEVLLLTNGPMRIGWSTKRTELWDGDKLGEDEFSIVFNGYNRIMLHQNTQFNIEAEWKAGDVVGCMINRETHRFYFFLNGHPLPQPDKLYFSPYPYYPSLSLSAHQQVYCNFDQSNFRYPQPNIEHLNYFLLMQKEIRLHGKPITPVDLRHCEIMNAFITTGLTNNISHVKLINNLQSSNLPTNNNHKLEPQLVASTSTITHKHQQQNVGLIEENSRLKLRIVELEKDNQQLKRYLEQQKCDSLTIVHAQCCDHLKFCTKCGSAMGTCVAVKCNRK